nr:MFS transporter [Argonema galeatum]
MTNEVIEIVRVAETLQPPNYTLKFSKEAIRSSLRASTWDGVFAAIFANITGGVLLTNFLLQLNATPMEIGILSSIPMLVNLLQPVGAYLASKTTSRFKYDLSAFGPSRLLWLILVLGIWLASGNNTDKHNLLRWTLCIVLASNILNSLGCASWLSWMATLVPGRLRGRYFGIRNSAANLTNLISIPLLGLAVSAWPGGTIQGYGAVLLLGVVFGLISLGCQRFMADVNPQEQLGALERLCRGAGEQGNFLTQNSELDTQSSLSSQSPVANNFLRFLLYFGFWTFAANVSSPFFNLYLLDDLAIDVTWVTVYNSLSSGANLLMLVIWGKLADRIGNRPILLFVGILVAVTPFLWLGTGNNAISLWVWLPLLHLLTGGTWAAIDLCNNNIQMGIAPDRNQATYFALVAAVGGVGGALATTAAGFLAQFGNIGGLPGLFALSTVLRLIALFPLLFVREQRSQPLIQVMRELQQICVSPRALLLSKPHLIPVRIIESTKETSN